MKKFTATLITGALLAAILPLQTAFAFMDVHRFHQNYDAITYLEEQGIINGYTDGTFKPYKEVNRAEFLKIILGGSDIPLDVATDTPFPDVNHAAWYAPYIKKAYAEGWVNGYPDGTFKPEQSINKVEALKILGEVQNWDLWFTVMQAPFTDTPINEWYINYLAYAADRDYLEETGLFFLPANLMTRGSISEVIYRTMAMAPEATPEPEAEAQILEPEPEPTPEPAPEPTPQPEPQPQIPDDPFTPITSETIPVNFFDNISLSSALPNTFYKNEVFVISGEITSGTYDEAIVMVDPDDADDENYELFAGEVTNNQFEIPVHFRQSGNYMLGVLPGAAGATKITEISVLSALPDSSNQETFTQTASSITINFKNNETSVQFTSPSQTIKKLTFTQNSNTVTYISRQNTDKIAVNYADFENFTETTTYYDIQTAKIQSQSPLAISSNFTTSPTNTFTATQHAFTEITDGITASPPSTLASLQQISFSGTAKADIQSSAYVIKPNGFTEELELSTTSPTGTYFDTPIILSGGNFQFTYTPQTTGKYIVEIVDNDGLPVINHPVYIGNIIPLIPDYEDLHQRGLFSDIFSLASAKTELLEYINQSRQEHGLSQVILSDELSSLAQTHSDDMANNNFFSHYNLSNEDPEDRRISAGVKTGVSENIAKDVSIAFAHSGLMRSATHRSNILESDWTRVGLGIALKDGYLYVVEEFSTDEITSADLQTYKFTLINEINALRTQNSLNELIYDYVIESACMYLNNKAIIEGVELTNSIFQEAINTYNVMGSSEAIGRVFSLWSEILSSILEESSLLDPSWTNIGIDMQIDNIGDINAMIILNQ